MADETFTEEEQKQIAETLAILDSDPSSGIYSPMQERFNADMAYFAPPPAEGEGETLSASDFASMSEGETPTESFDFSTDSTESDAFGDFSAPTAETPAADFDFLADDATETPAASETGGDLDLSSFDTPGDDFSTPTTGTEDFDFGTGDTDPFSDVGAGNTSTETPATEDFTFPTDDSVPSSDDFGMDFSSESPPSDTNDFAMDSPTDSMDFGDTSAADSMDFSSPSTSEDLGSSDFGSMDFGETTAAPSTDDSLDFGDFTSPADTSAGDSLGGDLGADLGGFDSIPSTDATPDFSGDDLTAGLATDTGLESAQDFGDLSGISSDFASPAGETMFSDTATGIPDASDLADMQKEAELGQGIGDEFTDEDLAKIRAQLTDYPPAIKRAVIDAVVSEKIPRSDQRLLMNMIVDQAQPDQVADFIEGRLGYRPDITPSTVRKDGVQIIYADELSPEALARRRRRSKFMLAGLGAGVLLLAGTLGFLYFFEKFNINRTYELGLEELRSAKLLSGAEKEAKKKAAEEFYQEALKKSGGRQNVEMMSRYGIAYLKAGYYDDAFYKLFGKIEPEYNWTDPSLRAPLADLYNSSWPTPDEYSAGRRVSFTARDKTPRKVEIPGAYLVSRLRDGSMNRAAILALGKFHSYNVKNFNESKYKNDALSIDYYRLILTLMDQPDDVQALASIGKVYYDRKEYAAAARQYNRIIDKNPAEIAGRAGLINTYLEVWKENQDPRFVIAEHRLIRKLDLEEDLPIYVLAKLAGFYTDLNADDLRIKYQVDPVDALSGLDIEDNANHVLEIVFSKTEEREDQTIDGSEYGEGFYQRGRFFLSRKESIRALRQFQNAHQYEPRHYLAINAMGEYYKSIHDYEKASGYFAEAIKIHDRFVDTLGAEPEDETLLAGDYGKLYYNLGSLLFLEYSGVGKGNHVRIYPDRSRLPESDDLQRRRAQLRQSAEYLEKALELGMKDDQAEAESVFWLGWIDYIDADFESALNTWEKLDGIYGDVYSDPALLLAKGNSYYYTNQNRSALGHFLKLKTDYERQAGEIQQPSPDNPTHAQVLLTLAAVYNNLGAVYEREYWEANAKGKTGKTLQTYEEQSLQYYWKAIENARKLNQDHEIARTNLQLAFKSNNAREPLLDDWAPPTLALKTE